MEQKVKSSKRRAALSSKEKKILGAGIGAASLVALFTLYLIIAAIILNANGQSFSMKAIFNIKSKSEAPVLAVGNVEFTGADYNYFYNSYIRDFIGTKTNEQVYEETGLDLNKPLEKQSYPLTTEKSYTWKDYFVKQTNDYLINLGIMYSKSVESGLELNDDDYAQIDAAMDALDENAKELERSLDDFIVNLFGVTCTPGSVRKSIGKALLAQKYIDYFMAEEAEYTDEEINEYISKNSKDFYAASYNIYSFGFDPDNPESIKIAKEEARKFINGITDKSSFAEKALSVVPDVDKERYENINATKVDAKKYYELSNIPLAEWLFDSDRQEGDLDIIFNIQSAFVHAVRFESVSLVSLKSINFCSMFIYVDNANVPSFDAGLELAETFKSEFETGGKNLNAFKEIAQKYPDYDPSPSNDGYYTGGTPLNMAAELTLWFYSDERSPGDYDIVEFSDGYYFAYLESYGDPLWKMEAKEGLRKLDFNNFQDVLFSQASVKFYDSAYKIIGI